MRLIGFSSALLLLGFLLTAGTPQSSNTGFATVRPIFNSKCVACHGGSSPAGGLRLNTYANVMKGGASGKVVIPHKTGESLLVKRIKGIGGAKMPPGASLSSNDIGKIETWIRDGAKQ